MKMDLSLTKLSGVIIPKELKFYEEFLKIPNSKLGNFHASMVKWSLDTSSREYRVENLPATEKE